MTKKSSDQLSSDEGIDKVKLRKQRNEREREEEERLMLGYSVATAIVPKPASN